MKTKLILFAALIICVVSGCSNATQVNSSETNATDKLSAVENVEVTTEEQTTAIVTTAEPTTDKPTEKIQTKEDILENGIWIKYSPQALVLESYDFSDGIIEVKEYNFENGVMAESNLSDADVFMTYEINGNNIVINDNNSREWTWNFTDNKDILEYKYQEYLGPEEGEMITQKIYRHDSLPSYETAMNERK